MMVADWTLDARALGARLLASIGQSREALRLAVALILVRIVASVAILPVHSFFKAGLSPQSPLFRLFRAW